MHHDGDTSAAPAPVTTDEAARAATSWLPPRLSAPPRVTSVVPDGYEAYARLLHPASDEDGETARWSDVAAGTGGDVGALVSWEDVATRVRGGRRRPVWDGEEPDEGGLDADDLAALVDVLARHTATAGTGWFCLWEGWSFPGDLPGARVHLAGRDHVLLTGPVSAAVEVGAQATAELFVPQPPSLFWPDDRAWCVGTDVDADSTVVAGSRACVAAVLASPALEAWEVQPGDRLPFERRTGVVQR